MNRRSPVAARRLARWLLPWLALLACQAAVAAITQVGFTEWGAPTKTTTLSLAKPTGVTVGDVLIAALAQDNNSGNGGNGPWTPPSGWTLVRGADSTRTPVLVVWYRVVTAADSGVSTYSFVSSRNDDSTGGIVAYRGASTSSPIAASGIQSFTGSGLVGIAPSISPAVTNTMLVAVWAARQTSLAAPVGMTRSIGVTSATGSGKVNLLSAYEPRAGSGATGTRTATEGTSQPGYGVLLALTDGASAGPDHYELSLPTASLSCLPTTVTVTACATGTTPCSSAYTAASGGTATLATSGATLGATTITFDASGVATTTLSYPAAADGSIASVTLSGESIAASNARLCCPNGGACSAANSCSTTFSTAGFIVSASAGGGAATVPAQTAGSGSGTYYLRAVKSGSSSQACEAALTGSTSVNWAMQCQDPTTCSSGNLLTLTGNSASAIAANPASGIGATTTVPMSFDGNGNAPFSFVYADVGQIMLSATKTLNAATLGGTSNSFVVKPASFSVTNVRQTAGPAIANPAAASATGGMFVKAGEAFTATVTSLTAGGAATPNFGRETSPEGVVLTPALVLPAGGSSGTLANATIAGGSFTNGAATPTTLSYSEVGIVTLTPSIADGSYLGAGNVSGGTSGNIGRFVPARFAVSNTSVLHRAGLACAPASTFSYLGENIRLGLTLTAQNLGGATTANYSGSFAKFDPTVASAWQLAGRDGSTTFTTANGRLALGSASGSWSAGVASGVTLTAAAQRGTAPDGPFGAAFGVAPVDSDGVALGAFDMAALPGGGNDRATLGTLALRFGRLRLANAIGAADRALALPATLQYWNGSAWDTNTLDSCTSVPSSAVSFGNLRRTLSTADTSVTGALAFVAGQGALRLAAPGGGRSGTADVALSLGSSAADASCLQPWTPGSGDAATAGANLAHLRGAWCGSSWGQDPSARASFGLQRTQDFTIYRRENY